MRIVIALFLVLASLAITLPAVAQPKLKIGFIGSLTGSAAAYGNSTRNGIELALSEMPIEKRFEVITEDDEFVPTKTVAAFKKLQAQGVDLIITVGSNPSKAVSPLARTLHMPLFAWASDQSVARGNEFVIRTYPSGMAEGSADAREILKRGFTSVAAIGAINNYCASWMEGLKVTLGSTLTSYDELAPDTKDFKSLIVKILAKKPQHLVICLNTGQNGLFAKQLRQSNSFVSISGCEYLSDSSELQVSDGALKNAWYVDIAVSESFVNKYRARFGNTDVISGAAIYYDLINILQRMPIGLHGEQIIHYLLSLPAQTGAIGIFRINNIDNDRYFDIPLSIQQVH